MRKRMVGYFVQVPRATIRDRRLGYKERGILAYLLDMPEGYEPTIERLADASDDDAKHSVSTGLMSLRRYGYYRVERRRLLNGTLVYGSAVSQTPVASWARDHEESGGKPVQLIEQADGTFLVRRPDGSLDDDGFTLPNSPPEPENPDTAYPEAEDRVTKGEEVLRDEDEETSPEKSGDAPRGEKPVKGRGRPTVQDIPRPDVDELCALLADLIEANGSKRPTISQEWRTECRRMLDLDKRDHAKTANLIRWSQADSFWRSNVMSMPKFREQYDRMRLQALAEFERASAERDGPRGGRPSLPPPPGAGVWNLPPTRAERTSA